MILDDARFGFLCCSCASDNDSKLLSYLGNTHFERRASESPHAYVARSHSFGGKCVRQCRAMSMLRQNQTPSMHFMCLSNLINLPARQYRPMGVQVDRQ